jgi:twinkle protein
MNQKLEPLKPQFALATELLSRTSRELLDPPVGVSVPRLPTFTKYLNGLRPHELTLICAGTGTGKTALISTIASEIVKQKVPLFAAPVETGDTDFLARTISAASDTELNVGEAVKPHELEQAIRMSSHLFENPFYISNYDNRVEIREIIDMLEYMAGLGVKVALLDNLNFFLPIANQNEAISVIDFAIHELVMFCKKFPMHVMLIVHPRKTSDGRVESEFDIKGSSTAVQECANVILFNRPVKADVESAKRTWFQRELVFKKIRKRGMFVNKSIWLEYKYGGYHECN